MDNFYDKVAKKFGGYAFGSNKPKYSSEYPNGNPEEIFKEKLLKLAKTNIVFCRRGPSFYKEYYRLLKKGGYYLEIGIGEKDCVNLKKVFGRGQGYGIWDQSRLEKDKNEFIQIDFRVIYAESISYNEYYNSIEALDRFLQGVPIFEDFNPDKDRTHLETYCKKFKTPKGILLPRQRVV